MIGSYDSDRLEGHPMKTLGLDIGTTTICAVIYDTCSGLLASDTVCNDSFLSGENWERIQDPSRILAKSEMLVRKLLTAHPDTAAIGLSGQMHGILYLDVSGNPVSPLYTWQDGRGQLPYDQTHSWSDRLSELTGYSLATGYGMTTHFYNLNHGLVPEHTAKLCTVQDYLAMKFSGISEPVMDATNAASLGLYDPVIRKFDPDAMRKANIDPALMPTLADSPCLGTGIFGIPVYVALGDNQASFLGATGGRTDVLLINMGTGGQISVYSPTLLKTPSLEIRPFPDGGWLLVGASLCGGRSYALLESFFRETVKMVTGQDVSAYEAMDAALSRAEPLCDPLHVTTVFQGTRKEPGLRGSIQNISTKNLTPIHLIYGVMQGMAQELYDMYRSFLDSGGNAPAVIIGSGNGLRKNPHLCRIFEHTFGTALILSDNDEEAACGAAIYAARHNA